MLFYLYHRTMKIVKIWISLVVLSVWMMSLSFADTEKITTFDIKNARDQIKILEQDIANITEELKILDNKEVDKYWSMNEKYKEVRWEIVKVIQNINYTTDMLADALKNIESYKTKIFLSLKELKETNQWMDETKKYIQDFTRYLYKLENEIYDEHFDAVDDLKLLVKSDNIATTLSNEELISSVMHAFNDLMHSLEIDQEKQKKVLLALHDVQRKAEDNMQNYQDLLDRLEQKKLYLIWFIKLYKKNSGFYEKFKVVFEDQKDVYTTMQQIIHELSLKWYKNDPEFNEKFEILKQEYDNTNTSYPLSWPIYPAKKIITPFKDGDFKTKYHFDNLWIQIGSDQWNPVYSSDDGIVYHVVANDNFTINWVVVMHPNNYVTIYSHLNKIIVDRWMTIKKGQLLGYSWGEPWTKGAWFTSQGEGLWYYIFKNWVAVDPMSILDLSVIQQRDQIPSDYNIKFFSDKYSRDIDITKVTFASGSTTDERAEDFLRKFAVGSYARIDFWNKAVENTNIDRDVIICIGFAESTLGRYLATDNNIGNVGNNDRGDRIAFNSPLFGAMMIPNTLNNSHLGHYHTIKQLSRYGNKDGKVYASSPINWQTNVTKCLSQIKGYYVPEDYPFRTGPNPNRLEKN